MTRFRRCLVPIIGDHFTIAGACSPVSLSSSPPPGETDAGHAPAASEAWRPSDLVERSEFMATLREAVGRE